jgi:hypothetical protein
MITINEKEFFDIPTSCALCPFFMSGQSTMVPVNTGHCMLFDETHHTWAYPPQRCLRLFKKAFKQPEGTKLVIVEK